MVFCVGRRRQAKSVGLGGLFAAVLPPNHSSVSRDASAVEAFCGNLALGDVLCTYCCRTGTEPKLLSRLKPVYTKHQLRHAASPGRHSGISPHAQASQGAPIGAHPLLKQTLAFLLQKPAFVLARAATTIFDSARAFLVSALICLVSVTNILASARAFLVCAVSCSVSTTILSVKTCAASS